MAASEGKNEDVNMEEPSTSNVYLACVAFITPTKIIGEALFEKICAALSSARSACRDKKTGMRTTHRILIDNVILENNQARIYCADHYTLTWILSLDFKSLDKELKVSEEAVSLVRCTIKVLTIPEKIV